MKLETLSDLELHQSNIHSASNERSAAVEMINHLVETNRRKLYSQFSCSSLHDYCVKHLKMTNGDAWRKISSARLIADQPELEFKLEEGSLTPTHLADAAAAFNREAFTPEQKADLLNQMENKSTEAARDIILENSRDPDRHLKDRIRKKTSRITEAKIYLDEETITALKRLKEIWSHAIPSGALSEIIKRATQEAVSKNDPIAKAERASAREAKKTQPSEGAATASKEKFARKNSVAGRSKSVRTETLKQSPLQKPVSTSSPGPHSTFSKAFIEHTVRLRDKGECTFVDMKTGKQCCSKYFLEFDHIRPKAMGGEYSIENLRLRCRAHNQRHAIGTYGLKKMNKYIGEPIRQYTA